MKIDYTKKILIVSVAALIIVLVLDFIFTNLLLTKIVGINDKVKQLVLSSQERERNLNLKETIMSSEAERAQLEKYFVPAGDAKTADFINYIESLAKAAGLSYSIKSVGYEPLSDNGLADRLVFIRFKLGISGEWGRVFDFLQTIENLPVTSTLNSSSFGLSGEKAKNSSAAIWSADLDFSVVQIKK